MADPRRILVVSGARALSRTPAARVWSLAQIATAMHAHCADTIVHGACEGPDVWADLIAREAHITRVKFPLETRAHALFFRGRAWNAREIADPDRYAYATPLARNDAMARWAGDRARVDDVRALTPRCDWPMRDGERATQGTAYARDRLVAALGAARVTDLVCPRGLGPEVSRG